jgi:hypothetical protein
MGYYLMYERKEIYPENPYVECHLEDCIHNMGRECDYHYVLVDKDGKVDCYTPKFLSSEEMEVK